MVYLAASLISLVTGVSKTKSFSSRCSNALNGDGGVEEEVGFGYDAKLPGEDTCAPCAWFVLGQELTGFRALCGSVLHCAKRISGYFFYEIHKTNLKIRTLDFTRHCTNTELGRVSVLKGLLEK